MNDIMLFGEGWEGEVRQIDRGLQQLRFIPHPNDPHLREVLFTVINYVDEDGDTYLIGYSGNEPLVQDIQQAIFRHSPRPV